jgi:signal peptidase II
MKAAVPKSRYCVFIVIAVVGCLTDLATKQWVFDWLGAPDNRNSEIFWLWPEYVGLQTSLNEGALFGLGQGKVLLFAALSVVAAVGIPIWLFYAGAAVDWLLCVALASISAGIFGNLYDRLGMHGLIRSVPPRVGEPWYAVRDFVLLQVNNEWRWPNFNMADSLLVCGAGLLLWHAFRAPASPCSHASPSGGEPAAATTRDGSGP